MSAAKEPASAIDVVEMTVERAQAGFAGGAFTSESLTQAFLDRIAIYNPPYNAIVFMNPGALDDAKSSDARRASGKSIGPLDGVPVVVKDAMDMAGFPTTGGWRLLHSKTGGVDLYPATDAPVVARMRAAGAVILGKTNIPVLSATGSHANDSWAGPTYNAAGREFLPGGSSAGTATAVAASLAVLGLAEETGGSIQNPASAQGLVGVKPTFALVPNVGVLPLSSLRDVVGPIGRCVRDAALALDALAGFTMADPKTIAGVGRKPPGGYAVNLKPDALRGKRVGTYGPGWRNLPLSEEAAALYRRALDEIEAQGAILVEDPFAGSGFANLRTPTVPGEEYDARGLESLPYDLGKYLERLGSDAAIKTFAEFAAATLNLRLWTLESGFWTLASWLESSNLSDRCEPRTARRSTSTIWRSRPATISNKFARRRRRFWPRPARTRPRSEPAPNKKAKRRRSRRWNRWPTSVWPGR